MGNCNFNDQQEKLTGYLFKKMWVGNHSHMNSLLGKELSEKFGNVCREKMGRNMQ